MAGHGVGVAWACVPGRGGDDLVGRDFALAECYPVHQGAAGGVGVAESLRIGVDVCGPRRPECRLAEAGFQFVQPLAHQAQVGRGAGPAYELPDKGAGAVDRYEVIGQRIARNKQLGEGPKLHDPVIVAVARGSLTWSGTPFSTGFTARLPVVRRSATGGWPSVRTSSAGGGFVNPGYSGLLIRDIRVQAAACRDRVDQGCEAGGPEAGRAQLVLDLVVTPARSSVGSLRSAPPRPGPPPDAGWPAYGAARRS